MLQQVGVPSAPSLLVAKRAALAAVIVVLAAGAQWLLEPRAALPILHGVVPWWTMLVLFASAEVYVLTARGRAEVAALAPQDGIFAIGLFVLDPVGLVAAQLVGAIVAFVVLGALGQRATARRLVALGLGAIVAAALFRGLVGIVDGSGRLGWLVALCAVAAGLVTRELVAATLQWTGRASWLDAIARGAGARLAAAVASGSVGVVAVELLRYETAAALLLLIPIVASGRALRVYTTEHAQLVHLRFLDESMRAVHRAPDREAGVDELLTATHSLLGTDVAWLVLFENRGAPTLVAWYTPEETSRLHPRELSRSQAEACQLIATSTGATPMARGRTTGVLLGLLADLRLAEAIATPVRGESGVLGVLVVGSRGSSRSALDESRILALETYADHAAILLENDQLEQSVYDLEQLKDQLRHHAFHDALTGLPNRALFTTRVAEALAGAEGETAVLFLDLDDFKLINDSFGHYAGDELLVAVAARVREVVRATDLPARLGGDEFAVLTGNGGSSDAEQIASCLVRTLEAPFTIDGREMSVHASVGFALGRPGVTTADELLRNADVAMYSAKHGGKRRYAAYEPKMHARIRTRQDLASALEKAVNHDEIQVHYQPVVDIKTRTITAVEALARWDRPKHGLLGAEAFIPLADEIGLMGDIGRSVLRQACAQAKSWESAFPNHAALKLNVNLSPSELTDPTLVDEVQRALSDAGLAPERLVLEITESGVMQNPDDALEKMSALRDLGIKLALDDFGTGHSSLAHLREFPIDCLKIAREFVCGLPHGHVDGIFVETIVRLATSLELDVVAEGIESERQAVHIKRLGCQFGQGYYYGAPVGPLGVSTYLTSPVLPLVDRRLRIA